VDLDWHVDKNRTCVYLCVCGRLWACGWVWVGWADARCLGDWVIGWMNGQLACRMCALPAVGHLLLRTPCLLRNRSDREKGGGRGWSGPRLRRDARHVVRLGRGCVSCVCTAAGRKNGAEQSRGMVTVRETGRRALSASACSPVDAVCVECLGWTEFGQSRMASESLQ
jgi:hypothetical protein